MCVLVIVDYDHVRRHMEARLIREGFIYDNPTRRMLVDKLAGPPPMPGHNMKVISRERDREEQERAAA